ncbi:MAG TPA: cupin domain-containing protein [Candidatus Aquilonibacter sp.]|nr:cupin domain-containing protein [Candidatus Aquilonibacter sp.]
MKAIRAAETQTQRGPAEWFDGEVWIQPVLGADDSPTQRSAVVSFGASARTAWHTHPRGQMLFILSGLCHAQRKGGEVARLTPGDAVWFAPGEKHWHGAAPGHPMVHLAVQEADENGEVVTWLEHVSG